MIRTSHLLSLALLTLPAGAQAVSVFVSSGPGTGDVQVLDPTQVQAPQFPVGLQGIDLLPIDFAGRTELQRILPDRPRRFADVFGASRLQLPKGRGSLYRYSRDDGAKGTAFGFFLIDSGGAARRVFERSGTGLAQDQDPFVGRIAVSPAGEAILVATTLAAGGDLLEVWPASQGIVNRTEAIRPLSFSSAGLALHRSWGLGVSTAGVLRFSRSSRISARLVPFSPSPAWYSGELVLSSNGMHAATTAGDSPDAAHVWAFSMKGPARRVTQKAATLAGAGFLPETADGPTLAISDDGTLCAWCEIDVQNNNSQEAFLANTAPATPQALHVTSDSNYLETLDGVGQFLFTETFTESLLLLTVGERSLGMLENIDQYAIALVSGGGATFENLSLSSGVPTVPFFTPSTIQPEGAVWSPQAEAVLMVDGDTAELITVSGNHVGAQVLLQDVRDLDMVEPVGQNLVLAIRRESGAKPRQIAVVPADLSITPSVVFSSSGADELSRPAVRKDGWFAFVQEGPVAEQLHLLEVVTGSVQSVLAQPTMLGPGEAFASNGDLIFSTGIATSPANFLRRPVTGSVTPLLAPGTPGFVLPGV